jgi:capsular polysaccharide transport system permease protein
MAVDDTADAAPKKGSADDGRSAQPPAAAGKPRLVAAKPPPAPAVADEKNKIVHIVRRLQDDSVARRAIKKKPYALLSLLVCVILPTLFAGFYYLFVAADRYVSEARFAIRTTDRQDSGVLGFVTGLPSSQNVSDSYIVADYLESRDIIEDLEQRLPLRQIYANERADYLSALSPDVPLEELVEYWQDRIGVTYDSTKNTIAMEVQAFTPEDAKRVTEQVVDIVQNLVNDLSARARQDTVKFAASEVARMELRLRGARQDMLAFRVANKELDPAQSAEATLGIAAELEGERSRLASQLASVSSYLSADAPSVQMLKSRIAALEGEISRIQSGIAQGVSTQASRDSAASDDPEGSSDAMANLVGKYQELALNQEFAEKAYVAAMDSLERARADSDRVQSYLAVYGNPSIAEEAKYPYRWLNILLVFIFAGVLWAVGGLAVLTVRDHVT